MKRSAINPMSERRRQQLAEAGNTSPFSTLTNTGAGMSRSAAARDVKPRPAYTGPSDAVKAVVDRRSGLRCEWPACRQAQQDRHHRLNRKNGGRHGEMRERINGAAWLLGACRPHHDRVTNPVGEVRAEAERMGWILREHQDAEATPALTRRGWELLRPDGTHTTCNPNHTNQPQEATA